MTILCRPRPRGLGFKVFENVTGGATQFQRGFRRDRFNVGRAADAVRAENFLWELMIG